MINTSGKDYPGYTVIVAHEFFDALPVYIYEVRPSAFGGLFRPDAPYPQKRDGGLHELKVDLNMKEDQEGAKSEPTFRYVLTPRPVSLPAVWFRTSHSEASLPIGSRVEISPLSFANASYMARLIGGSMGGGSALIVDYGKGAEGDTFRVRFEPEFQSREIIISRKAFKDHKQVHPLEHPGAADITTSVDFSLLKIACVKSSHPSQLHLLCAWFI